MTALRPVTLQGSRVRLEPLALSHFDDLVESGRGLPEVWRYMGFADLEDPQSLRRWMESAVREPEKGESIAFAIVALGARRAVGCSSLLDYSAKDRRVEIGRTWLARSQWRTGINAEAKRLLLAHAFDGLGCNRVQLKTDSRNLRSQEAIARLGAVREGVLRSHMVMPDGHVRDSVVFSITAAEWPAVRAKLSAPR